MCVRIVIWTSGTGHGATGKTGKEDYVEYKEQPQDDQSWLGICLQK